MLDKSKDLITFSKAGMHVLSLGMKEKREVTDNEGFDRMIHSLESCNFLKLNKNNYLLFECARPGTRVVSIQ